MRKKIFEGVVQVEIQGDSVLDVIGMEEDHVVYRLLGFEKFEVAIADYREVGLEAVRYVLKTGKSDSFAEDFCYPAKAKIWAYDNGDYLVELHDTAKLDPNFMLWMVVGMPDDLPVYHYVFYETARIKKNWIALFSLYRRPRPDRRLQAHFSSARVR